MVQDRVGNAKSKLSRKTKNGEVRKSWLSMFDSVRSSSSAVSVSQSSSGGDDTGEFLLFHLLAPFCDRRKSEIIYSKQR